MTVCSASNVKTDPGSLVC